MDGGGILTVIGLHQGERDGEKERILSGEIVPGIALETFSQFRCVVCAVVSLLSFCRWQEVQSQKVDLAIESRSHSKMYGSPV